MEQKAKIRWLEEGDRNTKFFHASVAVKTSIIFIHRIKNADGIWVSEPDQVQHLVVKHFQNLLAAPSA